jgi:hypothetical protein
MSNGLHTPLNRLPNLLGLRTRNALLDIPVFENTKRRHLTYAQFLRNVLALLHVVGVELDLRSSVSERRLANRARCTK